MAVLVGVAGAGIGAAPPARADSIVFVVRGDVARVDPDRPGRVRVLRRGTGAGYVAVSQADDGSIVAQRGRSFERLSATGRTARPAIPADPRQSAPNAFGPFDPELSPDGRHLAWWNGFNFVVALPTLTNAVGTLTDRLNLFTGPVVGELFFPTQVSTNARRPRSVEGSIYGPWVSWSGNRRLVSGSPARGALDFQALDGRDAPRGWFSDPSASNLVAPRVSRRGDRLAAIQHSGFAPAGRRPADQLRLYRLAAPPPRVPAAGCVVRAARPFREVSWSPDGRRLAWSDGQGIWVARAPRRIVGFDRRCRLGSRPRLIVRGGDDPHWGPAEGPRPRPRPRRGPRPRS